MSGDATSLMVLACAALVHAGAGVLAAADNSIEAEFLLLSFLMISSCSFQFFFALFAADACLLSPARDASVITVAAITQADAMPSFSDGGVCVDMLGPGYQVLSAYYGDDTGTA